MWSLGCCVLEMGALLTPLGTRSRVCRMLSVIRRIDITKVAISFDLMNAKVNLQSSAACNQVYDVFDGLGGAGAVIARTATSSSSLRCAAASNQNAILFDSSCLIEVSIDVMTLRNKTPQQKYP